MSEIKVQYGHYMKEMCCEDCNYAGAERKIAYNFPPMPVTVCPDCGGELKEYIGRWMYTEVPVSWWETFGTGSRTETTYHGFQKGRAVEEIKNLSQKKNCDCPGCKICDSGHGYQPCHGDVMFLATDSKLRVRDHE